MFNKELIEQIRSALLKLERTTGLTLTQRRILSLVRDLDPVPLNMLVEERPEIREQLRELLTSQ